MSPHQGYRILFVCTANICRSPAAEALARHQFGEGTMMFRSAGFLAAGRESPRSLVQVLGEGGIDVSTHRSYQLDEPSLKAADLVLTMEGDHVRQATDIYRQAFPKIIPITEAAQQIELVGGRPVDLPVLIAEINRRRDPASYLTTKWDVEDPYKRKLKYYRRAVHEISGLVDTVIGRLA